jgi:hypothetical protein
VTVDEQLTQNNAIELIDRVVVCFTIRGMTVVFNEGEGSTSYQRPSKQRFSRLVNFSTRSRRRISSAFHYWCNPEVIKVLMSRDYEFVRVNKPSIHVPPEMNESFTGVSDLRQESGLEGAPKGCAMN